jgi:HTH-type transcriptional regulator/antitoxin MqsA
MTVKFQDCACCGSAAAMVRFEDETFPVQYRRFVRNVRGLNGWRCRECAEVYFDPQSSYKYTQVGDQLLEDAHKAIAEEMRRIRRKLNLTQRNAVEILSGGGHNAFSRYERAEVEPPKPLLVLMSLLDRHPALVEEIKAMGDGASLGDLVSAKEQQRHSVLS